MTTQTKAPSMSLDAVADGGSRTAANFSDPSNPALTEGGDEGVTLEFGRDGSVTNRTLDPEAEAAEPAQEETSETKEGGEPAEEQAPAEGDLPDYDSANEEVHAAYEERFYSFGEDGQGTLNMGALESAWEANNGSLPEGVYAFLTASTGISKEAIKDIEAGRVALREKAEAQLHAPFGGKEGFETAFKWATEGGGYTADQKARFNAALDSKDPAAIQEAYELLSTRHKAGTKTGSEPASRRRAAPRRTASGEANPTASAGPQPYADNAAYLADAKAKGATNPEVRKRLEASTFWRGR